MVGITLDDVWARRGDSPVLAGVSLAISAGEVMAVLGPSGCGKTSLLRAIAGFLIPERGRIRLGEDSVSVDGRIVRSPEERNLAMVFQDLALWPHLTVYGNLAFGLDAKGVSRVEREARISHVLRRVDLAGKEGRHPTELSGGERQRVAIARALVLDPQAVLLDEPLSNLDVGLRRELVALFHELLGERRPTAIYVTHEPWEAAALGHRIAIMMQGAIVQIGRPEELRRAPANPFVEQLVDDLDRFGESLPPNVSTPRRSSGTLKAKRSADDTP